MDDTHGPHKQLVETQQTKHYTKGWTRLSCPLSFARRSLSLN